MCESSRLWRETVNRIAKDYPEVEVNHMYVDNCAMQLVRNPGQFDVIVTSNIFGDILSDEASMISGSIGMLASASLGSGKAGLYETNPRQCTRHCWSEHSKPTCNNSFSSNDAEIFTRRATGSTGY